MILNPPFLTLDKYPSESVSISLNSFFTSAIDVKQLRIYNIRMKELIPRSKSAEDFSFVFFIAAFLHVINMIVCKRGPHNISLFDPRKLLTPRPKLAQLSDQF